MAPDISPSTKIKTGEPAPPPEPTKIDVKPDDVAPPKEKGPLKFYKKLKSAAGTVADAAASDIGISIIESAVNEIDKSHAASTLIGSALRGHRGRKTHAIIKKYPEIVNKRLEDVKKMDPQKLLQYNPKTDDKGKPLYLQKLEENTTITTKDPVIKAAELTKPFQTNSELQFEQDIKKETPPAETPPPPPPTGGGGGGGGGGGYYRNEPNDPNDPNRFQNIR